MCSLSRRTGDRGSSRLNQELRAPILKRNQEDSGANPQNQQSQSAHGSLNQYYSQRYNVNELNLARQPAIPVYNWRSLPVWDSWSQTANLNLVPADDALRAHLGLSKDEGLVVTSVIANGPAAQAGVQQNDVLLKLGETPLAKVDDLDEALKATGEKPSELMVLRGGKRSRFPCSRAFG